MTAVSVTNSSVQVTVTQGDGNRVVVQAPPVHIVTVAPLGLQGPPGGPFADVDLGTFN